MPSRWTVTLPGVDATTARLEHVHAVVSGWFDDDDTAHYAKAKPYTLCPPRAAEAAMVIEIGLLTDELPARLARVAAPGTRVRLGSTWSRITRAPHHITTASWDDLTRTKTTTAWSLRFVTPTTFRRGNRFTPAPTLSAILGSLRSSWRRFAPPTVAPLVLDLAAEPVWLTDVDVTSHVVPVGGLTVSGFTGRLRFACDGSAEQAAAIDRLVGLAPFAGVGAYTTRGFGMTRPEATWPPTAKPGDVTQAVHQPAPQPIRS
jgi:CRISPR-associated endoribonuclease Cas6